jgi:Lamin Tail Domain
VDTANYSGNNNWPAGSASPNYASMERRGVVPDGPAAWVTFAGLITNTPLDRNGNHVYSTPDQANWARTVTVTPSPLPTATLKPTPTFAQTPVPAVDLNEILARPSSDWNSDGAINNGDEFIEVENLGPGIADLTNWKLEVNPNRGSSSFTLPSLKLNPNERKVFFGSTTQLLLEDSGETVTLTDSNGVIEDAFTYPAVNRPDDSWCRTRDGIGFWRDGCFPTPGVENELSGILPPPPPPQVGGEAACQLPDVAPSEFRLAECNGSGANIWNQKYWNDLSGQNEYEVPDSKSKAKTYIQ